MFRSAFSGTWALWKVLMPFKMAQLWLEPVS
jgi:hypothetical protein